MDPDTIEKSIISVWEAFVAGPYPSLAVFVPAVTLVWFAAKFFYKQQIVTLKDRGSTKDERLALMREKFEASDKARQDLETKLKELEEAIEHDATERREEVSSDVGFAVSSTEAAIEHLKEKERDFSETLKELLGTKLVIWDDDFILRDDDVIRADDLKRIPSGDKDTLSAEEHKRLGTKDED